MAKWYDVFRAWWSPAEPEGEPPDYFDVPPEGQMANPPHKLGVMKQGLLARWREGSKRDQQLTALQAGYTELLELIRSIRMHLDGQAQGQTRLLEMLAHLPAAVDSLKSVGKTSEQQGEILQLLRRQLESGVAHDEKLVESMNRFNETLAVMEETSRSSAQTMTRLAERTSESEETLGRMLERSERRLVVLISFLAFVTVLVVGTGIYLGVATSARRAAAPPPPAATVEALAPHGIAGLSPGAEAAAEEEIADEAADTEPEEVLDTAAPTIEPETPEKPRRFLFFRRRSR